MVAWIATMPFNGQQKDTKTSVTNPCFEVKFLEYKNIFMKLWLNTSTKHVASFLFSDDLAVHKTNPVMLALKSAEVIHKNPTRCH